MLVRKYIQGFVGLLCNFIQYTTLAAVLIYMTRLHCLLCGYNWFRSVKVTEESDGTPHTANTWMRNLVRSAASPETF